MPKFVTHRLLKSIGLPEGVRRSAWLARTSSVGAGDRRVRTRFWIPVSSSEDLMDISVIIVGSNAKHYLELCLESLVTRLHAVAQR